VYVKFVSDNYIFTNFFTHNLTVVVTVRAHCPSSYTSKHTFLCMQWLLSQ